MLLLLFYGVYYKFNSIKIESPLFNNIFYLSPINEDITSNYIYYCLLYLIIK